MITFSGVSKQYGKQVLFEIYQRFGSVTIVQFERSLALAPNFAMAKAWQARVVAELERVGPSASGSATAAATTT